MKTAFLIFFSAILLLSIVVFGVIAYFTPIGVSVAVITIAVTMLIVIFITIKTGYWVVPNRSTHVVEFMGEYYASLKAGWYILFPFFGFANLKEEVFLGVQKIELYNHEEDGSIEFKDASSSITAYLYYQVINSYDWVYSTDDHIGAIREVTDHLVRSFFSELTIDQAIESKSKKIDEIACIVGGAAHLKDSDYYQTLMSWGAKPIRLAISDIDLPPEILEGRELVFKAEQERQAAEKDKAKAIINASKEVEVSKLLKLAAVERGKAQAAKIKQISKLTGLTSSEVVQYLIAQSKWEAAGESNLTIIEGSKSAELGAAIGAGMGRKNVTKEEKGGDNV